jgi:hypothetical protein
MVVVALSGNLDFVPLDEVLRLLTRSEQQGSVDVRGDQIRGRIFISKRGVGLATVADDKTLRGHLVNSGYVDEVFLDGVESGEASLAPLAEDPDGGITALLREMTIESLYQLSHKGVSFEVTEGASSPYASPSAFDLEVILADSRRRTDEWAEVSRVVADLTSLVKMNREIGDQESVEISRSAWKLLSEMGSGASVNTLAGRLGTTEFWTARVAAGMAERGLLRVDGAAEEAVEVNAEAPPAASDESWWQEPEGEDVAEAVEKVDDIEEIDAFDDADAEEPAVEEPAVEEPAAEDDTAEEDEADEEPEKSRFFGQFAPKKDETLEYQQFEDEDETAAEADSTEEVTEEIEEEAAPIAAEAEIFQDALPPFETAEPANVEEDTEAFLEKVFSELESNGQPEQEGHGLLRRRRLGSVLKELDED